MRSSHCPTDSIQPTILQAIDRADHLLVECPTARLEEVLEPVLVAAAQHRHQVLFLAPTHEAENATVPRLEGLIRRLELPLTVGQLEPPNFGGDARERSLLVAGYSWFEHRVITGFPEPGEAPDDVPAVPVPEVIVLLEAHLAPAQVRTSFGIRITLADLLQQVCSDLDHPLDESPANSPDPETIPDPASPSAPGLAAPIISVHACWHQLEAICRQYASHRLTGPLVRQPLDRLCALLEASAQAEQDSARGHRAELRALQLVSSQALAPAMMTWGELAPSGALVALRIEPLRIDTTLRTCVWETSRCVLAISDCLSVAGNGELLAASLGLDDPGLLLLPHPTPGMCMLEPAVGTTLTSILLGDSPPRRALVITSSPVELRRLRPMLEPSTHVAVCLTREQLEAEREELLSLEPSVLVLPTAAWSAWGATGLTELNFDAVLVEWPIDLSHDPEIGTLMEHHAYEMLSTLTIRTTLALKRVLLWAAQQPVPPRVSLVPASREADWLTPLLNSAGADLLSLECIFADLQGLHIERPDRTPLHAHHSGKSATS